MPRPRLYSVPTKAVTLRIPETHLAWLDLYCKSKGRSRSLGVAKVIEQLPIKAVTGTVRFAEKDVVP